MGRVMTGLLVVLGLWVGVELMTEGPARAFGGLFADFVSDDAGNEGQLDNRSTARRAGDSVTRARDEAAARRERMLGE